ncbi:MULTISPECIES: hypothetical protein [Proteus]|uniref:Phage tail tape measure protein n=1 Tax=Proteus genomosp. 6 TaxID=1311820 RepID=A0ABV1LAR0_9GAMM|nr:hypothetical protein [Proteus cibi]
MTTVVKDLSSMSSSLALNDAQKTVSDNMKFISGEIDSFFGKGFAKANPSLVAELTKAISIEFNTTIQASVKTQLNDL